MFPTETSTIYFAKGIPGFPDQHQFLLLHPDPEVPLFSFQCVKDDHLAWVVAEPFIWFPNYQFELSEQEKWELHISKPEDVLILNILTLRENLEQTTINLKAPLVINVKKKLGRQCILDEERWLTKHPLTSHRGGQRREAT